MVAALALLERTGWEVSDVATGRDLADRFLGDTPMETHLTETTFAVSAAGAPG